MRIPAIISLEPIRQVDVSLRCHGEAPTLVEKLATSSFNVVGFQVVPQEAVAAPSKVVVEASGLDVVCLCLPVE